jgi:hypothetical protein
VSGPRPVRGFAVRHAHALERAWLGFERALGLAAPTLARIGWDRLERPVAGVERVVKGALFGCRMCGACALSSTGMACPMHCPKQLRNGPCGGVRADGGCEIRPAMRCVWIAAWEGARAMRGGARIRDALPALDHRLAGRSSWLAVARASLGTAA